MDLAAAGDWFAINTFARLERWVMTQLRDRSCRVFFPFLTSRIYVGKYRTPKSVDRPLFPGYVFLASDDMDNVSLRETAGVNCVVRRDQPIEISGDAMRPLIDTVEESSPRLGERINREKLSAFLESREAAHWFKGRPGDIVELAEGAPYHGLKTVLTSIDDLERHDMVSVRMFMLGAERDIAIPARAVVDVIEAGCPR